MQYKISKNKKIVIWEDEPNEKILASIKRIRQKTITNVKTSF